jgi:urea transport system permease protein
MNTTRKNSIYIAVALLIAILPLFFMSNFRISLLSKFWIYGMVAVALNILWGYTGILSLGHGIYFALGGYAMAMHLKLKAQPLPDFMEWSGIEQLPWFWQPFSSLPFTLLMVVLLPVLFSLLIGIPSFKSGIKGVYFTIMSQAITMTMAILFIGQQPYTGGTNGLTGFNGLFGYPMNHPTLIKILYMLSVATLGMVLLLNAWLLKAHAGKVWQAIRDKENRLRFLGYPTDRFKVYSLALSAAIAGIAGALFVPVVGIISPSSMNLLISTEFAIWVAIGGRGTLFGPVIGALLINFAKTTFSETFPEIWWYFYGALFIVVTLLFPRGITGTVQQLLRKKKEQREEPSPGLPIPQPTEITVHER